ncbi:AraC family transcriptional regulator [Paenibacillus sacheonensis]|uniref:Helix-turn-helix domain-containing protein n=1 Tax=Paenibacillus sacheonensis TaxID=742054 RepID=A0A7X5C4X3_9BACL|nr:AraC family transcriptional regulator [Paenibacillus sacheonensis]MBM7567278.1 AraC-like DNA-binding protein [Paenibacillus sacheonensis]NBC72829.1 helix-turn-helix domain-containing protein [Paenibacillus sacheonensis]
MRMLHFYKSKRYLLRMLLSISILLVMLLSLSSAVIHYSAEHRVLQMQQEANRKVMNQINHNLTFMQEIINNIALSLYNDERFYFPLMSTTEQEDIDLIYSVNLLNKAMDSQSFLHSILVYNGHSDKSYALGPLADRMEQSYMTGRLVDMIKKPDKLPQLQLIPMNFSGRANAVDFFSVIIYESFTSMNDRESAIVLNVKPEWVFDNLAVVNGFSAPNESSIFLMDNDGRFILSGDEKNLPELNDLSYALKNDQSSHDESFGFFSHKFDHQGKTIVSYLQMGVSGWKVISVQPYNAVLGGISQMRETFTIVIISFLLLAVAVSFALAHKLYRPIEALLSRVTRHGGVSNEDAREPIRDEFAYVGNVYGRMAEKLVVVTDEKEKQKEIVRHSYLRSILTGSSSFSRHQLETCIAKYEMKLDPAGPFLVVVVKIDDYAAVLSRTSESERQLYAFATANIAGEILAPLKISCEMIDARSDHLVLLLSGGALGSELLELPNLLQQLQDIVQQYYKISLSLSFSEIERSHEAITEQYTDALHYAMYKILFGRRSIITPDLVRANVAHTENNGSSEAEKKLTEAIKTNDLNAMEACVKLLLAPLHECHYDRIIHGVLHVVDVIKTTIREINQNRISALPIDLSALSRQVLDQETLSDISALLQSTLLDIHEKRRGADQDTNSALIDAIKDIIETQYADMNLSLQGISATLKMTSAYVGRMFKQSELVSVSEYLNEVRLTRAREYLETKSFSIKEIMELVGYVNESTFFKLFKKKYGVTPKEYRLKSNIG